MGCGSRPFLWLAANSDNGRQSADTVLALLYLAAKPGSMCRVRRRGWRPASAVRSPERCRAVVVKAAHRIEVSGERFQVPASNCSMMLWMLASMAFLAVCRFGSSLRMGVGLEVITTDPNELLEWLPNRMPVIIQPKDYDRWLPLVIPRGRLWICCGRFRQSR